jgi:dolichyl-phosphate beta-glucosyltransferase
MQKTAIIIPCFNEAGRIRKQEFVNFVETYDFIEFIFVNDGSTDSTSDVINKITRSKPDKFHIVNLQRNSGKAESVRQGFLNAFEDNYTYIGFWDADLATPLHTIIGFLNKLQSGNADIVIGSRVKLLGRRIQRKAYRHYLGRIFATFVSLVLRLPVYDTQCGAKIFKNSDELKQVFKRPFKTNWIFDVEILARFIMIERTNGKFLLEQSVIEYPLEEWIDVAGSKLKPRDFLISIKDLLKITIFLYGPFSERRFAEYLRES